MQSAGVSQGGIPKTRHHGRGHVTALDGVRGLAVLGVMATHLLAGNLARLPALFSSLLGVGVAGVDVFFVLSGFLITGILRDSMDHPHYFRLFYGRRSLRIFPLYYGVVLCLVLLTGPLKISWNGLQVSLLLYLQNTHLLSQPLTAFHHPAFSIDHLWSLAVEEQFYLAWPLVVALIRSPRYLLGVCATGVAGSFCLRLYWLHMGLGYDVVNRNTLCRADELLAGAALVLLLRSRFAEPIMRLSKPLLLVAGTLAMALRLPLWGAAGLATAQRNLLLSATYTVTMLFAAALILRCMQPASATRAVCEWRYLRTFGRYSYGLYVLHLLLLPGLTRWLLGPCYALTGSKVAARLGVAAAAFVLSCAAAYLSFHLYEKRFLRLKRFFEYARPARPVVWQPTAMAEGAVSVPAG